MEFFWFSTVVIVLGAYLIVRYMHARKTRVHVRQRVDDKTAIIHRDITDAERALYEKTD